REELFFAYERCPVDAPSGELLVERGGRRFAGRIDEEAARARAELVARRPVDRPRRAQLLVRGQDLLGDDPRARGRGAKAPAIPLGVAETIEVIDPHSVHETLPEPIEYEAVGFVEDARVFAAQPDQTVDVEEPAIAEVALRRAPIGEPVVLALEER